MSQATFKGCEGGTTPGTVEGSTVMGSASVTGSCCVAFNIVEFELFAVEVAGAGTAGARLLEAVAAAPLPGRFAGVSPSCNNRTRLDIGPSKKFIYFLLFVNL